MNNLVFRNEEAFELLFKENYSILCRIAKFYFKNDDLVEDVVCETFIKLWDNRDVIEIKTSVLDYLIKSLKNTCVDYYRKEKIYKDKIVNIDDELIVYDSLADLDQDPCDYLVTKEVEEQINIAIDLLPERYKMTFQLVRIEGLSYEEAASVMKISKNTIKSNLRDALNILRFNLKDLTFFILLGISVLSLFGIK